MTFELLSEIMSKCKIPKTVKMLSDSGWECSPTDMDAIYYSRVDNTMIFTQRNGVGYRECADSPNYTLVYVKN